MEEYKYTDWDWWINIRCVLISKAILKKTVTL